MKKTIVLAFISLIILFISSCGSTKNTSAFKDISDTEKISFAQKQADTIIIANENANYEIIIVEPGFNSWLASTAKPIGYYSQSYLENRNVIMVTAYNQRVMQPQRFNPSLYEMQINYQSHIDYGYEVNYKLYNYFIYFQRKYRQRLGSFMPRI